MNLTILWSAYNITKKSVCDEKYVYTAFLQLSLEKSTEHRHKQMNQFEGILKSLELQYNPAKIHVKYNMSSYKSPSYF